MDTHIQRLAETIVTTCRDVTGEEIEDPNVAANKLASRRHELNNVQQFLADNFTRRTLGTSSS